MKVLTFPASAAERNGHRTVRRAAFDDRSSLPIAAACVVAGGIRERLGAMLGAPVSLHVLEPRIPSARAWHVIVRAAWIYAVRGSVSDAAIVLRPDDALAMAAAAFGEEPDASERALSAIESEVLERTVAALAGTLGAVCGEMRDARRGDAAAIGSFSAYFEVAVERPVLARIGVAVAREPEPEPRTALTLDDLAAVPLAVSAGIEVGTIAASRAAALAVGDVVPILPSRAPRGILRIGGRRLAAGTCGARNGCYALQIEGYRG
ncbi:MAG: FliM/FliN family flagellar motor switch protein [Candidatus Eremiobacteraeota bacterium]|nr:FliM/FliN family flagellar motor switch protein [Candidatus Eremiobacteraeota bacterium]